MSYSNLNVELSYDGNDVQDEFSVNFHYKEGETTAIKSELWNYTDADSPVLVSPWVLNTEYTIDETNYPDTKIVTAVPVATNYKLNIYRETAKTQTTNLSVGAFPAESVEEMVDRVAMMAQEVNAILQRAILYPIGGPTITYEELIVLNDSIQAVADNAADIATNAADIATNLAAIAANAAVIATNASNISTNAGGISTNATAISTNVTSIANNATAIGTNATDISTNAGNITTLDNTVTNDVLPSLGLVRSLAAPGAVNVNAYDIAILGTNGVGPTLPAAAANSGKWIVVKLGGAYTGCVILGAENIDGYGLTYALESPYEMVKLISDGTQWYII